MFAGQARTPPDEPGKYVLRERSPVEMMSQGVHGTHHLPGILRTLRSARQPGLGV